MSETITIDSGLEYTVYAGLETADYYVTGVFGDGADAWEAATELNKQKALITATRRFEEAEWDGEQTDSSQELAWPRSGLTDIEGNELDDETIPDEVVNANIELALDLLVGTTAGNQTNQEGNVRRLKADVAEIEYFRATTTTKVKRFPTVVQRIIGRWLSSDFGTEQSEATGVDECTHFDDDGYELTRGF